ncbi:MAG: DNA repair protein RecO [Candidatus Omnitrophota bacterium]
MTIQKTQAIVLKNQDIRETSLLLTLFTKDFGKIQGIAKGIRGKNSRISNSFEPFSYCNIVFYEKKRSNLHLVSHCDLKRYFHDLRKDLIKVSYAYYFTELVKNFLQLHDKNEDIFNLLFNALDFLDKSKMDVRILARAFELKLLSLSGFKPKIDSCLKCSALVKDKAFFNFSEGGLLCPDCAAKIRQTHTIIKQEILFFMHLLEYKDLFEIIRLKITPRIHKDLILIIHQFMNIHIEKKFKSLDFVRQLECLSISID